MTFPLSSRFLAFTSAVLCLSASAGSAAVLAQYNFGSNVSSSDTETGSAATAIVSGGGLGTAGADWGRSSGANDLYVRAGGTSDTPTGNNYLSFTLNITPGVTYDLTSLVFNYRIQIASDATTSPDTFTSHISVRSSLNSFAASLGEYEISRSGGPGATVHSPDPSTIDLSSYTNVSGTVEFRFYVTDNTAFSNDVTRLDNIILSSVPEAGTSALAMSGMLFALAIRKRPVGV